MRFLWWTIETTSPWPRLQEGRKIPDLSRQYAVKAEAILGIYADRLEASLFAYTKNVSIKAQAKI